MAKVSGNVGIRGLENLAKELNASLGALVTEGAVALYDEVTAIMEISKGEVPEDTQSLLHSAFVDKPVIDGDRVTVRGGYSGPHARINPKTGRSTEEYAVIVHEDLTAHHPKGKAKFLEDPMRRRGRTSAARIVKRLRRLFR